MLELLPADSDEFIELGPEYVEFNTDPEACDPGASTMTWIGDTLSVPLEIREGDILKVCYPIMPIPDEETQMIQDFIFSLPLADQRDVRKSTCYR